MRRKNKLVSRLLSAADLPEEPIPGQPIIEIVGQQRVLIENHVGVIEYGDCVVRIKVKYGAICVEGCRLELTRMTRGQLIISGKIESIKLERR